MFGAKSAEDERQQERLGSEVLKEQREV